MYRFCGQCLSKVRVDSGVGCCDPRSPVSDIYVFHQGQATVIDGPISAGTADNLRFGKYDS